MRRIAVTCGDPAGIGPEVAARWLREQSRLDPDEIVLIGYDHWIRQNRPSSSSPAISVGDPEFVPVAGKPTREGAQVAAAALEAAARGAVAGDFDAVVTGPVSKKWMQNTGWPYRGQTEFFADHWEGEPTMAFFGLKLKVALVTWHLPLEEVPAAVTPERLQRTVRHATGWLRALGIEQPRLGVCGLNPHAGEAGLLGVEEHDRLDPALRDLQPEFPGLSLCQPADSLFWRALQNEFDLVIALYHDQGLAPLKTVEFEEAAQVTLGLAHIRTSPDHGTAFGIAGLNQASARSFDQAIQMARLLAKRNHNG